MDSVCVILFLCCTYFTYKFVKYLSNYVYDKYILNDNDFPPEKVNYINLFPIEISTPCHITAKGIFSILTGIKIDSVDILVDIASEYNFDTDKNPEQLVTYIEFVWCTGNNVKSGYVTSQCHVLVYYNGFIFQSLLYAKI